MTTHMERIIKAIDDPEWQKFRISLKGQDTLVKLRRLREYYFNAGHYGSWSGEIHSDSSLVSDNCDICIRMDNYLKALARGGQLYPRINLEKFMNAGPNGIPSLIRNAR
jgi:hypothetical protein